jgi:hypothetical protein
MFNIYEIIQSIFANNSWESLNNQNVNNIENGNWPGIYLFAFNKENLEDILITPEKVFYVGMSNAIRGVKSRINQFRFAIENGYRHSAGNRFYEEYCDNEPFSETNLNFGFYFKAKTFQCNVIKDTRSPKDLQTMGEICRLEYYLLAHIKECTHREPDLNQQ